MLPKLILTAALVAGHVAATNNTTEYDYVIVGSGPGGGSLAANLATQGYSVFLIEAGGDESDSVFQTLPLLSARAADSAPHAWQFFVDHYSNETQALRDSKYTYRQANGSYYVGRDPPAGAEPLGVYYPRGATLGGSSQVNAMNFAWAPDNEWDYIANLTGDPTWSHQYLRQYLMALENCSYVPVGTPGHGFDGYLESSQPDTTPAVTPPRVRRYLSEMFRLAEGREVDGIEEMAQLMRRDTNRIDNDRYAHNTMMTVPLAISNTTAARSSIAHYIRSVIAAGHPLTLSLHSLANRVLFEECDGKPKAVGVEYLVGDGLYSADMRYNASQTAQTRTVRAKKEVIVAGGTFNTPQILKLSGVGPREELERWGIPVVVDLPAVGNYMQDNYEAPVIITADVPWMNQTSSPCPFTFNASDPCYVQWQQEASGPYTQRPGTFVLTLRSNVSWDNDADLFYLSTTGYAGAGFWPGYSQRDPSPNSWTTAIVKMQTGNPAGTVTLRSLDPRQAPAINFNYFSQSAERDLQALEEGINLYLQAHDNIGTNYTLVTPNPEHGIRQGILDESFSHHASSSCRMGRVGDRTSCVDSKFRVHGVDGLRIVDASVFPRVPGAMPNGPTFTISYKAFVTIMEENQRKQAS